MLDPDVRRLYSECFAAPAGYVLDGALGTTYSLDLDSLLFAMFCLATSGADDPAAALNDAVGLLEAIHRVGEQVTVFCHAGETHAPTRPQALYSLLERSLVPARGRGGAIFHPKLWLLRFRSTAGNESLLRAVVLSRNLTSSRAWDAVVCLEGNPLEKTYDESRQLAELVRALPGFAVQGHTLPAPRLALIESLARDAERTRFEAPLPFDGVASFRAVGTAPHRGFEPAERGQRLLAISPFVSPETLSRLREVAPRAQLVGRVEEMSKCPPEVIASWEAFVLHEGANSDADVSADPSELDTADAAPQGLHAKALVIESSRRATWWLGSGNLTDPVRSGSSVELMVRLEGKPSQVGIEKFWDSGFGALLVPYRHQPLAPDPAAGSRTAVSRAKRRISEAALALRCEPAVDFWDLVLEGALPDLDGVVAACRPVSLPAHHELGLRSEQTRYCFKRLTLEALTAFLAIRLTAGTGETRFELSFALKLPLAGLPDERDARITRAIIKDRAAFLSYLRCLFADSGTSLEVTEALRHAPGNADSQSGSSVFASGLLESMLRTLRQDPERLHGLRTLLKREASAAEDPVIPEDFRQLWAAIEPHLPAKEPVGK